MLSAKELRGKPPSRLPLGAQRRIVVEGEERVLPKTRPNAKLKTRPRALEWQRAYRKKNAAAINAYTKEWKRKRYYEDIEAARARGRESMRRRHAKLKSDPIAFAAHNAKRNARAKELRAKRKA